MGGGLLQVITYGTQDLSLTGNPQITFFHTVYRRYTNFGKKIIELSFNNSPDFNSTSYINIPKNNGDLFSKLILKIKLPKIDLTYINNLISEKKLFNFENNYLNSSDSTIVEDLSYYNYFIEFLNKLKNIINIFFIRYDNLLNNLSYIIDLKKFILSYINIDEYIQFFNSVNFFYNQLINFSNSYNIQLYTNSSLFKIVGDNLIYIYDNLTIDDVSYEGFKFTIYKNIEVLEQLNLNIYEKIKIDTDYNLLNIKFCWVNKIAIYLINSIDLYIGSNKIYSLSDTYINNYSELYYKNTELYNQLIGNESYPNIFSTSIDETVLYLPIPFWNILNYGLSFPLISLQFNSIQIKINTKKLIDCIRIDTGINNVKINNEIINMITNYLDEIIKSKLEITLNIEYLYLDSIERNKFARSAHEYLIEQVQQIEFSKISQNNNTIQLDIFHCCKDMFWFIQKVPSPTDLFSRNRDVFNYIYTTKSLSDLTSLETNKLDVINYVNVLHNPKYLYNPFVFNQGLYVIYNNLKYLEQISLLIEYASNQFVYPSSLIKLNTIILASNFYLNGTQLFSETNNYFNFLQSYVYYNSTPQLGLNVYSFCLRPTEFQPTGSCNMSRISYIGLKLKINDKLNDNFITNFLGENQNVGEEYKLIFQTRNFNVLRIIGGIGATAYTYN